MRGIGRTAVLLLAGLAACDGLATGTSVLERRGAGEEGVLQAEATPAGLRLTNSGRTDVYYFAIDGRLAALALWAACSDPRTCPRVPARSQATVGWEELAGYEPGAETTILVYWWYLVPAGGGTFEPDSMRVVPVRL